MNNKDDFDSEAFLIEYQTAQESAQHHDNLVWTITSIIWGASLILLGLILNQLHSNDLKYILTLLILLIMTLIIFAWKFSFDLNNIKNQKYKRCKEIESKFNMNQHTNLNYTSGFQKLIYNGITVFYIIIWVVILIYIWSKNP